MGPVVIHHYYLVVQPHAEIEVSEEVFDGLLFGGLGNVGDQVVALVANGTNDGAVLLLGQLEEH